MLLRRFLLIICVLFTLIAIDIQLNKARASSYTYGQYLQAGELNVAHSYKASARAQTPICPKIPTPQKQGAALLAFCAPKYLGIVAGPYGSHIVLVGENLPQIPSAWLITSKNQPVSDSQKLVGCTTQSTPSCLQLPAPQVSKLDKSTLFSWTWGKDFPNKVGDYNITAIIEKQHAAQPQIVSTAVSFTLLTSEAPCITLDNTNCSSTQPMSVIDLSKTRTLILSGSNWALGWGTNPITESIEVTASCSTPQYCANRTPLFDIIIPSSQIDADGGFSSKISLPTNISGTYNLAAINHVQTANTANDTFADGTLSFGNIGDINSLAIRLIPPPVPPTINTDMLNILAAVALLLASAGIAYYYLFFRQRQTPAYQASTVLNSAGKQQFIQSPPIRISSGTLSSSYSSLDVNSTNDLTKNNTSDFRHKHRLVDFPPKVAPAPKTSNISWVSKLIRSSTPNFNRKIQRAIQKWREQGDPEDVFNVAADIFYWNTITRDWNTITRELERPLRPDFPPYILNQYVLQAVQTIHSDLAYSNPQGLLIPCIRALVYCALVLPWTQEDPQKRADILFDMGFAYINLAAIAEYTSLSLLTMACNSYKGALYLYKLHQNTQDSTMTLVALGDTCYALSEVSQVKYDDRVMWRQEAYRCYQDARLKILPHQQIDIDLRLRYSNAKVS